MLVCKELYELKQLDENLIPVKYQQSRHRFQDASLDNSDDDAESRLEIENLSIEKTVLRPRKVRPLLYM